MTKDYNSVIDEVARNLTQEAVDRGRLVEAGWKAFAVFAIPPSTSATQLEDMKLAYMAGAEHLFASIMVVLDPGSEPTISDLKRMDLIANEIQEWRGRIMERVQREQKRRMELEASK